jgi:hypothetical protein
MQTPKLILLYQSHPMSLVRLAKVKVEHQAQQQD